ncbi:MAG: hypothetical protein H6739_09505 [Alphaproteobacteria bacterium]|nr:hypothetical protein [Alphaproteobacteria bacterium]
MLEMKGSGYRVWFEPASATVHMEGTLRLNTGEYAPLTALLNEVIATGTAALTLHVRELVFLNSSGINTLYKFALALRKRGGVKLTVLTKKDVSWQSRSLPNLQRFYAEVEFEAL